AVAALDISIQAQVLNLLTDIRRDQGVAFVFVSHDLGVIEFVAEDVLVMYRGRVVERGRTQAVLNESQHPDTQLLVESLPRPGWQPEEVTDARARFEERSGGS